MRPWSFCCYFQSSESIGKHGSSSQITGISSPPTRHPLAWQYTYCREPPPMGLRGYDGMRTGGGGTEGSGPTESTLKFRGLIAMFFSFLNMLNHGANISLTEPYWWAATIYIQYNQLTCWTYCMKYDSVCNGRAFVGFMKHSMCNAFWSLSVW